MLRRALSDLTAVPHLTAVLTLATIGLWSCSSDDNANNDATGSGGFTGDGDTSSGGVLAGSGGLTSTGGSSDPGVGGSLSGTGGMGAGTGGAGDGTGGVGDNTGGTDGSGGSPGTTPVYACPAGSNALTLTLPGSGSIGTPVEPPAPLNNRENLEGPVWINGSLYASQLAFAGPGRILRYTPGGAFEELIANSSSNGLATDASGTLYAARQGNGSVSSYNLQNLGQGPSVIVDQYQNAYFKSPNDLALRSDETLYFTDPDWQEAGNSQSPRQTAERAYWVSPDRETITAISPVPSKPNGIMLSPDESTLYIGGSGSIMSYSVAADGSVTGGTNFGTGGSDGFGMDCAGNLYATSNSSVVVFRPNGSELGRIDLPGSGSVTNVAFGGTNRSTLFVTRMSPPRLYSVDLNVPGFPY